MRLFAAVLLGNALVPAFGFTQDFSPSKSNKPDEATRKSIVTRTDKLGKELTELRRLNVRDHDPCRDRDFSQGGDVDRAARRILRQGLGRLDRQGPGPRPAARQPGSPGRQSLVSPGRHRGGRRVSLAGRRFRAAVRRHLSERLWQGPAQEVAPRRRAAWPRRQPHRSQIPLPARQRACGRQGPGFRPARHLRPRQQRLSLGRRNRRVRSDRAFQASRSNCSAEQACSIRRAWCCAASPWAAPARGSSACTIPTTGASSVPAPASPPRTATSPRCPTKLSPYQEKCLRIYDAVDYAENAFNVPVVAYGGADDPQLQAAKNIEAKLKPLGIPMKLLVAPGLGHRFPPNGRRRRRSFTPSTPARVKAARNIRTRSASSPTR